MRYSDPVHVRAAVYANARGVIYSDPLGFGKDGAVWLAKDEFGSTRAVKVFEREEAFRQELRVYQRLSKHTIVKVGQHSVPVLRDHDETLGVLGMTVVTAPYILDFASATLDAPPDFPRHVMRERERHWLSVFGPDRWSRVQTVLVALERLGIHYLDPTRRNIAFHPDEEAAWDVALAASDETDHSPDPASDSDGTDD